MWFGSDSVLPGSLRAWLTAHTPLNWNGIVPAFSNLERYPFWMGFGVLFIGGAIIIIAITLLTPAEPMATLVDFYERVRPIGIWGPVARAASPLRTDEEQRVMPKLMTALVGVAFYFLLTTALFHYMGGHLLAGSLCGGIALLAGYIFAKRSLPVVAMTTVQKESHENSLG